MYIETSATGADSAQENTMFLDLDYSDAKAALALPALRDNALRIIFHDEHKTEYVFADGSSLFTDYLSTYAGASSFYAEEAQNDL